MTDVQRRQFSEFFQSDDYYAGKVAREYEAVRDALCAVQAANGDEAQSLQVLLEGANRAQMPLELILDAFEEPPALDAYFLCRKRILEALEFYLHAAISAKREELLRDYNIQVDL